MVLMSLLNAALLAALFVMVERQRAMTVALKLRSLLPAGWRDHWFMIAVVLAAGTTAWWSAAVLQL
ncbi:hypothetical protein NHF46_11455 [Arthrobacter alpinus]|nr:hypothetical protein [Arthrobacter alpinus]